MAMPNKYKMNEGRNAKYYFQFSDRESGKILLEGTVTGGNKQDCINHANSKAREAGLKPYADENLKLYIKRKE